MSKQRFEALKELWQRELTSSSSTMVICGHPAYMHIVDMGIEAVPYILQDMIDNGPDHWFVALYLITKVNPVKFADRGKMQAMTDAWIDWGRKEGYIA
ncbi:MAG: hypothetical protein WBE13_04845 [Candidatus Acidiferrum sp.]